MEAVAGFRTEIAGGIPMQAADILPEDGNRLVAPGIFLIIPAICSLDGRK